MKKFLVVLLALVMVFGLATSAFAADTPIAEFNDISSQSQAMQNAIQRLAVLGVVEGNDGLGGSYRPEETLTRAEFAKIAVMLSGVGDENTAEASKTYNSRFPDVTAGNWYTGWVNIASENGFMYGDVAGTFRPNAEITMQEVSAALLRLAGYDDHVGGGGQGNLGTWPHNYNNKARAVGLTDDVASYVGNTAITRGDLAIMANNVLEINMVTYVSDSIAANLAITSGRGDADWFVEEYFNTNEGDYTNANILYKGFDAIAQTVRFAEALDRDYDETSAWGYADFNDGEYELKLAARKTDKKDYTSWVRDTRVLGVSSSYHIAGDYNFPELSNMIAKVTYTDNSKREVLFIEVTSRYEEAKQVYRDSSTRMSVDGRSVGLSSEVTMFVEEEVTNNGTVSTRYNAVNFVDLTSGLAEEGVRPYADYKLDGDTDYNNATIVGTSDDDKVPAKVYFDEEGRVYSFKNYNAFDYIEGAIDRTTGSGNKNTTDTVESFTTGDYYYFGIYDKIQSGTVEYKSDVDPDVLEDIESEKNNYIIYKDGEFVKADKLNENDMVYYVGNDTGVHTYVAYGPSEGDLTKQTNSKITISGFAYPFVTGNLYYSEDGDTFEEKSRNLTDELLLEETDYGEVLYAPAYNFGKLAYIIASEAGEKYVGVITRIGAGSNYSTSNQNQNFDVESITILNAEGKTVTYKLEKDFMDDYNEWLDKNAPAPGANGALKTGYYGNEDDVTDFLSAPAGVQAWNGGNGSGTENDYVAGFQRGMIVELRLNSNDEITRIVRANALNPTSSAQKVEVNRNNNRLTVPNGVYSKANIASGNRNLTLSDNVVVFQIGLKDQSTEYSKANVVSLSSVLSSNFESSQVFDFKMSGSEVTVLYIVRDSSEVQFDLVTSEFGQNGKRYYTLLSDKTDHEASNHLATNGWTIPMFITYTVNTSDQIVFNDRWITESNYNNFINTSTAHLNLYSTLYGIDKDYNVIVGQVVGQSSTMTTSSGTLTIEGWEGQMSTGANPTASISAQTREIYMAKDSKLYNMIDDKELTSGLRNHFEDRQVIAIVENHDIVFLMTFEKGAATAPATAAETFMQTLKDAGIPAEALSVSGTTVTIAAYTDANSTTYDEFAINRDITIPAGVTLAVAASVTELDLGSRTVTVQGNFTAAAGTVINGKIVLATAGTAPFLTAPQGGMYNRTYEWNGTIYVEDYTIPSDTIRVATALGYDVEGADFGLITNVDGTQLTLPVVPVTGTAYVLAGNLSLNGVEVIFAANDTIDLDGNTITMGNGTLDASAMTAGDITNGYVTVGAANRVIIPAATTIDNSAIGSYTGIFANTTYEVDASGDWEALYN